MYNARFVSERGREFRFGFEHGTVFDIDPLSGATVTLSTDQGYMQAGSTVTGKSVAGINRKISGVIIAKDKAKIKGQMLSAFAPSARGKLYFNDLYFAECDVKKVPEFQRKDFREIFEVQLYCAYPYWLSAQEHVYDMNVYEPAFLFPVNYAEPHIFGVKNPSQYVNCINYGEEAVPFTVRFTTETMTENYRLTNVHTLEYLAINDTLHIGETVTVRRQNGILTVQKQSGGETTDIFEAMDEESNLFDVQPGDNMFVLNAESGLEGLNAFVMVSDAKAGVYDGIE